MKDTGSATQNQSTLPRWTKIDVVGGATLWTAFAASFGVMLVMG